MSKTHEWPFPDVDLNLLPTLAVLLETSSVTQAAAQMGVTQSAMSRSLGRLRRAFGDELLVRVGQRMQRTPRAAALLPQVHRVLAEARRLVERGETFDPTTARFTARLSSADYVHLVLMPPLLKRLQEEAPYVSIRLVPQAFEPRYLEDDELDGLLFVDGQLSGSGLMRTYLFTEPFVTVLRSGHPALGALSLERYAALNHVLVAPSGRPGGIVDDALTVLGLQRRVVLLVPSFSAAIAVAESTDLVVTLPKRVARATAVGRDVVVLPPPLHLNPFRLVLFWHRRRKSDPAHRWLRKTLAEVSAGL
ncbi:MAG: LysR family transcriptional regulator [Myxococcota bacterium]